MTERKKPTDTDEDELFELEKPLGVGGFAHTYLARVLDQELIDEYGTDLVALKIPLSLQKQKVLNHEVEHDIYLQMRLRSLNAENLCKYLGFAMFHGQIVMVMEYVPQGSLRRVMGDLWHQRRLPVEDAIRITRGVLRGLIVIHRERVFHRDIKPENILMDGDTPKISDLGIARMMKTNELASSHVGTLYYMSPEMLGKEGASFPSDIWSLGVTLYEMVTGRLPFGERDMSPGELIDIIRYEEHRPVHEVCADVPPWLGKIIDAALQKQMSRRTESAQEMLNALSRDGIMDNFEEQLNRTKKRIGIDNAGDVEPEIRQLIEKYPDRPQAYGCLGEYYNRCQLHREALEAFCKGLEIDENNAMLHWNVALAYQLMGRWQDAIKHLERATSLDLDPNLRPHVITLLKALKLNKANDVPMRVLEDSNEEAFREDLARIHELISDRECETQVEKALLDLIEKYPFHTQGYQCLGEYYSRCHLDSEAIDSFRKGLKIDESDALLHWDIALAYQRVGRKRDAVRHLKMAMSMELDPGLRRHAATLLKALGAQGQSV